MYLWLKAFHLIVVVTWFAGLFYLPRLFIYHMETAVGTDAYQRFCLMEQKLFRIIMIPSLIFVFLLGLGLMHIAKTTALWLHIKLACVVVLWVYQWMCWRYMQAFRIGRIPGSARYFRLFNEVPSLLLIIIVLLAVLKPF